MGASDRQDDWHPSVPDTDHHMGICETIGLVYDTVPTRDVDRGHEEMPWTLS